MTDEKYVQVRNLAGHSVVYNIPEDHVRRVFGPTETKKISVTELNKLYEQPGGATLIRDFLGVEDDDTALEFGVPKDSIDHEYKWTKADVENLLKTGSVDALEDALDFAPEGIIDLIITVAVETRTPDIRKRMAIQEHTGKDIGAMIQNQIEVERQLAETNGKTEAKPAKRRVAEETESEPANTGRRVS